MPVPNPNPHFDETFSPFTYPRRFRERRAALAAECERIGRDPATVQFSIVTGVLVGTDRAELEERAVRTARFFGESASDPASCLEGLPKPWLIGTPAEIVERLRTLESLGVNRIMLWAPRHDDLEMIALLGREVLPSVRAG